MAWIWNLRPHGLHDSFSPPVTFSSHYCWCKEAETGVGGGNKEQESMRLRKKNRASWHYEEYKGELLLVFALQMSLIHQRLQRHSPMRWQAIITRAERQQKQCQWGERKGHMHTITIYTHMDSQNADILYNTAWGARTWICVLIRWVPKCEMPLLIYCIYTHEYVYFFKCIWLMYVFYAFVSVCKQ